MRFALRSLLKHPGSTALAVISLATGLGLVTALASLADALLFHPLPVAKPSEIVRIYTSSQGQPLGFVSYPDFDDFRRAARSVRGLVAQSQVLIAVGDPAQVRMGMAVTSDYFDVLGVPAAVGRTFRGADEREPVVVLAHSFWQSHYGGRRDMVGRTLLLGATPFTVIGVAARTFGLDRFAHEDFYVPMGVYAAGLLPSTGHPLEERGRRYLNVFGRLRAGSTAKQANAEVSTIAGRLESQFADTNRGRRAIVLTEYQARTYTNRTIPALAMTLVGTAAVILVMACANVAGLMLMRAEVHARQVAVRIAVGASHAALLMEGLVESLLLSMAGAVMGLPLAWGALRVLTSIATFPADISLGIAPHLDVRVGLVLLSVTTFVTMICGAAPALAARRIEVAALLKLGTHGASGGLGTWRRVLVIAEIALASALIGSGGVLIEAIADAQRLDLGYRTDHVLVMALDPAQVKYSESETRAYYDVLGERVREVPGVTEVALAQSIPLGFTGAQRQIEIEGQTDESTIWMNIVSNDYFGLMGIPIAAGRAFDGRDTRNSPLVVVVNEELAKRCGIGGHIRINGRSLRVIGVAKNAKYFQLGEAPRPYFYLPYSQNYASRMFLEVRAASSAAVLAAVHGVDHAQPVSEVRWLRDYVTQGAMFNARIALQVVGVVGLCGLALALAGLYGVVAHGIARRRREIGLRMALGARRREVVVMIVWRGGRLVVAGTTGGLAGAWGLARTLAGLVAERVHITPWVFAAAAGFVILVSLAACLIPAWNATAIDPACTLREE